MTYISSASVKTPLLYAHGVGACFTPPPFSPAASPSPPSAGALAIWQEKLDYLQQQEAITADAAQKFAIKKQIEEAKSKIRELSENPS